MSDAEVGAGVGAAAGSIIPGLGTAVGAGLGGLAGGILDYFGAQSANNMNWEEFASNQAWNTWNVSSARDYNERLADTAHQREVWDLRQAGINPMMTAMGGNGAPSPTSPVTNPGTGAAAINPAAGLGRSIAGAIPSALDAFKTLADIKNTDKDSLFKEAGALSATAQAQQATASAKQLQEVTTQLTRSRDAAAAEADARKNRAGLDLQNDARDRLLNQIKTGSGIAADASSAVSNMIPTKALSKILNVGDKTRPVTIAPMQDARGIGAP